MKFNTAVPAERKEAMSYFMRLANKRSLVEVKKISPNRTVRQNSYLHLIIGAFGVHFGYTLEEAKQIYKQINSDIYYYRKNNRAFVRSSADISKEDMAKTIDKFREKSAEAGCDLPLATDQEWLRQIENEIERSKYYL